MNFSPKQGVLEASMFEEVNYLWPGASYLTVLATNEPSKRENRSEYLHISKQGQQ